MWPSPKAVALSNGPTHISCTSLSLSKLFADKKGKQKAESKEQTAEGLLFVTIFGPAGIFFLFLFVLYR